MRTKEKTFKQKWNLLTLRKIRDDLELSDKTFLCDASEVFRNLWEKHRDEIAELAIHFSELAVNPPGSGPTFGMERTVLFYHCSFGKRKGREIRIDFLNSEIAKKTKKTKKK